MDFRGHDFEKRRFFLKLLIVLNLVITWAAEASVESIPASRFWVSSDDLATRYSSFEEAYQAGGILWGSRPGVVSWTPKSTVNPNHTWDFYHCPVPSGYTYSRATGSYTLVYTNGSLSTAGTVFCAMVICPEPIEVPISKYVYNSVTGMCERPSICPDTVPPSYYNATTGWCEQKDNLTITLKPDRTTTEPSTNLGLTVTVENQDHQPPKNPVQVKISLKVDHKSGGHDHGDSTRPRGGINSKDCVSDDTCVTLSIGGSGSSGSTSINFNARDASGEHTVTAICDKCSNGPQEAKVKVKVEGLKPIPPSGLYALYEKDGSVIGAVQGRHPSNHYLTPTAANKLLVLAINYHHLFPQAPVLHVNDASLMWGGVFDYDAESEWDPPHKEHRRGTVVDIRANSREGAIPAANFDAFVQSAQDGGMDARIHNSGLPTQHYHVRLLNRSE